VQAAAAQQPSRAASSSWAASRRRSCSPDADLDAAVPAIGARDRAETAARRARPASRVLIEGVRRSTVSPKRLAAAFARLADSGLPSTDPDVGPLINGAQFARVRGYVRPRQNAMPSPSSRAARGPDGLPAGGFYVEPTLFGPVPRAPRAGLPKRWFGPVLSALGFADESDAIRLANATQYGLVAGVWRRTEAGRRA